MSKLCSQVFDHEETGYQERPSSCVNTSHLEYRNEVSSVHVNNCISTGTISNKDHQPGTEKMLQDEPVSCNSMCPDLQV